jgi:hypothetical protein
MTPVSRWLLYMPDHLTVLVALTNAVSRGFFGPKIVAILSQRLTSSRRKLKISRLSRQS